MTPVVVGYALTITSTAITLLAGQVLANVIGGHLADRERALLGGREVPRDER